MKIELLNEIASICCVPYQTVDDVISALVNERILECYPSPDTETFEELSFSKSWHRGRHLEKLEEATKSTPIDTTYIMKHRDGLLWKIGRTVDIPKRAKAISGHDRGSFLPVFWVYEPVEEPYSRVMPHLETEMIQACKAYLIPGERELLKCPPEISAADFESLLIGKLSCLKQERLPQLLKRRDNIRVRYALLAAKWEEQQKALRTAKAAKAEIQRDSEKINFGLGHFNAEGWAPATKTFWKYWHSPMKTFIRREGFAPRPFGDEIGANTEWVVFRSEKFIPTHLTTKPRDTHEIGEVINDEVGANTKWVVFRSEKFIPTHLTTKPRDTHEIGEVINDEVGANTKWVVFRSEKFIPTHLTTKPRDTHEIGEVINEVLLILQYLAEFNSEEE